MAGVKSHWLVQAAKNYVEKDFGKYAKNLLGDNLYWGMVTQNVMVVLAGNAGTTEPEQFKKIFQEAYTAIIDEKLGV